jgi:hypothetical protein
MAPYRPTPIVESFVKSGAIIRFALVGLPITSVIPTLPPSGLSRKIQKLFRCSRYIETYVYADGRLEVRWKGYSWQRDRNAAWIGKRSPVLHYQSLVCRS